MATARCLFFSFAIMFSGRKIVAFLFVSDNLSQIEKTPTSKSNGLVIIFTIQKLNIW